MNLEGFGWKDPVLMEGVFHNFAGGTEKSETTPYLFRPLE
jgi:hypothetical protein